MKRREWCYLSPSSDGRTVVHDAVTRLSWSRVAYIEQRVHAITRQVLLQLQSLS